MDVYVRARLEQETKDKATEALKSMGLTISDAIRMTLVRIAEERRMPFAVEVPNKATAAAIAELEAGGGVTFQSVDAMFKEAHADT